MAESGDRLKPDPLAPVRIALMAHLSEVSGAGVALLEVARGLDRARFEPLFLLPGNGPLAQRAHDCGVEPHIIPNTELSLTGKGSGGGMLMAFGRVGYVLRLARYFRRERIGLVYVNSSASVFAGLAARLAGCPVVWHVHETLDRPGRAGRVKMRVIEKLSRGILYASETAQECFPAPGVPLRLIARNRVAVREIAAAPPASDAVMDALEVENGHFLILANGVIRRKGPDILLQALRLLRNRDLPPFHLVLIGEGASDSMDFVATLEPLARREGVSHLVTFAGRRGDVASLLRRANLYVSASRNEALPMAIIEAMAAGTPVVATDVGDCARLLEGERLGIVAPPDNPQALAEAMREVAINSSAAVARADAAQTRIIEEYGADDFWKPLEELLAAVVSARGK